MREWLSGYRAVTPLAPADAAMLPAFVMLRRMVLTAWIAPTRTKALREVELFTHTRSTMEAA